MPKYRAIPELCGYWEVQFKTRWWPFWRQCAREGDFAGFNLCSTLEEAARLAEKHSYRYQARVERRAIYFRVLPKSTDGSANGL